ncbi:SpoU rRNA Methylase family protein [Theileria parva strain Muguga]|uniref:Uncharacterized protein n=1 Tax=Theileria parva TaxID=5875 RepID=Q4N2Q6_THEPA|nr:SpoU rRNA Methylase family protein [Theileria parva strain Muguga]EAN31642.1 SpoU rRNA Methylase family protein [Theileria parva strain Muguga]|eukprot:XP_763925.1 hypothetical protein [Theileria parva strain Muguga]
MTVTSVVGKILEDLREKSLIHSKRNKKHKLKDSLRTKSSRSNAKVDEIVKRRRFIFKPFNNSLTNSDFFTRLVNSSPKPPVLRSIHHPVVNHLLKLSYSSNYRSYRGLVLLSSLKLIKEYCSRNGPCNRIYTTSHSNKLLSDPDVKFDKVLLVSKKVLQKVGNLKSYDKGLLAEVPYPKPSPTLGIPKLVLCLCPSTKKTNRTTESDLGTLIRSAQALQWQAVWVLQNGNIDLLDPLTIRSSHYSLSTIPYSRGTIDETLEFAKKNDLLLCHCCKDGIKVDSETFSQKISSHKGIMLMAGNLPYELFSKSTKLSVIPRTGFSEDGNSVIVGSDVGFVGSISAGRKYTLDDQVQTAVSMYLIKKMFFNNLPSSPFIHQFTANFCGIKVNLK